MKKWLFSFIALSIVFIISIGSAEIMLRVYDKIKGVTSPYTHNLPECIAIPNGYFNYDLVPNLKISYDWHNPRMFSINRWGFRSPDYDPIKPRDVIRIFCFGGSSTFDPFVSDEQSWTYLIGQKLSKKLGRPIESINAGRYGYGTSEILGLFYHRVLRHQPDMIILYSTYNDALRKLSPYYSVDDGPQYYGNPILGFLNRHSALFAFLNYKLRYIWTTSRIYNKVVPTYAYLKEPPREHREFIEDKHRTLIYLLETFKRNVRTIIHIAKDNNAKVLLSTQLINKDSYTKAMFLITEALRELSQEEGVPILDLDEFNIDEVKKESFLSSYIHLSPKGCEFLSDNMVDAILKNNLIEKQF